MTAMESVIVAGVGMHAWGKFPNKSFVDLGVCAVLEALADAGIQWKQVQSLHAACNVHSGVAGLLAGNELAYALGETGSRITSSFNGCASSGIALRQAFVDVASGACDIAVAAGAQKSAEGFLAELPCLVPVPLDFEHLRWQAVGAANPAYWALECRKRMVQYGTTEEDLAEIKVILSKHGANNPRARYRKVFTREEVLRSPMVADPLRLLEVCAVSDGAAAVVLCNRKTADRLSAKKVYLRAVAVAGSIFGDPTIRIPFLSAPANHDGLANSESVTSARAAYEMAGIDPADTDAVELPDNSAWHVLEYLESLGMCRRGEAEKLVRDRAIAIGGDLPVCPSGGFACLGEVVSAQGLAQMFELTSQLRGAAGTRQVEGAKLAVAQTLGAMGNSATFVLTR